MYNENREICCARPWRRFSRYDGGGMKRYQSLGNASVERMWGEDKRRNAEMYKASYSQKMYP